MTESRFFVLILAALSLSVALISQDVFAQQIDPDQPTVLITGSNRGIGLAFAGHYAAGAINMTANQMAPKAFAETDGGLEIDR